LQVVGTVPRLAGDLFFYILITMSARWLLRSVAVRILPVLPWIQRVRPGVCTTEAARWVFEGAMKVVRTGSSNPGLLSRVLRLWLGSCDRRIRERGRPLGSVEPRLRAVLPVTFPLLVMAADQTFSSPPHEYVLFSRVGAPRETEAEIISNKDNRPARAWLVAKISFISDRFPSSRHWLLLNPCCPGVTSDQPEDLPGPMADTDFGEQLRRRCAQTGGSVGGFAFSFVYLQFDRSMTVRPYSVLCMAAGLSGASVQDRHAFTGRRDGNEREIPNDIPRRGIG